jgi:hypothetical protein
MKGKERDMKQKGRRHLRKGRGMEGEWKANAK